MTSKAIVTAVASVALAGGALVVVTAPASSAAPGCQYPANIVTTTSLKVKPQKVQYGAGARARVVVNATGSGRTPKGQVIVTVAGRSSVKGLSGGAATVSLPRKLAAGNSYGVRAKYDPKRCSRFQKSTSSKKSFKVVRAHSKAKVNVDDVKRGNRPKASVRVKTATGVTAKGKARVRISHGGTSFAKTVRLRGGSASTKFKALNKVGKWKVRVSYKGTGNIRPDSGSDTFRVKRRR